MKGEIKRQGAKRREDGFTDAFASFFTSEGYHHVSADGYGINSTNAKKLCFAKEVQKGIEIYFYYRQGNNKEVSIYYGLKTQFSSVNNKLNITTLVQFASEEMLQTLFKVEKIKNECAKNNALKKVQAEYEKKIADIEIKYNK